MGELLANLDTIRIRPMKGEGSWDKASTAACQEQLIRLLATGTPLGECAQLVHRTIFTCRAWLRQPEMQEKLKELNSEIFRDIDEELKLRAKNTREKLDAAADEAVDKLIDLMRGADSEVVQMRCSQDLLDRRPDTSKIHRVDKRVLTANISVPSEWLEAAAQVAQEEGGEINGGNSTP